MARMLAIALALVMALTATALPVDVPSRLLEAIEQPPSSPPAPHCLSDDLYSILMNAGEVYRTTSLSHEDATRFRVNISVMGLSETAVTILVCAAILLASLPVLLAGQKLTYVAVLVVASLSSSLSFFIIFYHAVRLSNSDSYDFYPCGFPVLLALLLALLVDILIIALARRFDWLPNFIFGCAAGAVGGMLLREVLIAQDATRVTGDWFNSYYWVFIAVFALIIGLLASFATNGQKGRQPKSVVIVTVTCIVGAYGATLAITALVNVCVEEGMPSWSFLAIAAPLAFVGFLFQWFVTGKRALEHRTATRQRVREVTRRGQRNGGGLGGRV
eukprot:CAMPEP_0115853300 /NCGR_PEP_ID=MMETSP0287-20121206/13433_1 /TAXON_ID=412157 /ORGANISM="Chrysochromulina rotalis, Strain UIO044" /LENGTH=330 /DNA_ID=CAMNT_0003307373 /DNA_START=43 /DNA_END=1035 /DNA_ORIENTATION=+